MSLSLRVSLLSALLLLAACRSDPIHYHTLLPAQPAPGAHGAASIQFEQISVPPQVDRPQMVIRQGGSGLAILETEWWGATLVDELRNALVDQLSSPVAERRLSLRLDVQRFDSVPGQYALIDAQWRLRITEEENSKAFLSCRTTVQTPSGASIDDLVVAHQNNVKRLAAAISQAATTTRCPTSP
ncbi:PqiC family protein [Pseudomonas kielensis]|jgi:uncharacterized lipoprotein YmbA|uniref:PqiC family protein n=1 Tax=Pseudomonas TaxID=286 RepID=UPI001412823F|nr:MULTISPECIES: PqiC family protein [Pseudomonas]NBB36422.1 hypothetical protein [Pseudomonas sp. BC115LW]UZM14698.1 PqiC family protein [Pseudomonas kielensis]WKL53226.1 PqiC family protein [Pseudomonas kielensis]